jgi:hypothetical protein
VCPRERGTQVALIAKQFSNKVSNVQAVDLLGVDPRVFDRTIHCGLQQHLQCRVLFDSEIGVTLPNKVWMTLPNERREGTTCNENATTVGHYSTPSNVLDGH